MITFTSKETYLKWRAEWRTSYKALSAQIREFKFARWYDNSTRNGVKMNQAQTTRYEGLKKQHGKIIGGTLCFWPESLVVRCRKQATAMLEERKASKVEAQRQYLEGHAKAPA